MVDLERIEVRGGVCRLDLRCTACGVYVGDRMHAEPTGNGTRWPLLGALIRAASDHECTENAPVSGQNRADKIDDAR